MNFWKIQAVIKCFEDGSSAVFIIALEKGREKKEKTNNQTNKQIITTRGIRIWSPIRVLIPPNRAT